MSDSRKVHQRWWATANSLAPRSAEKNYLNHNCFGRSFRETMMVNHQHSFQPSPSFLQALFNTPSLLTYITKKPEGPVDGTRQIKH